MGWGNSQRRRGAAPRHYNLPPPGPGFLIRQTGIAYGDSSPDAEQDAIPTRVRVYSLEGEPLGEATVDLHPGEQDDTVAVRVDRPSSSLDILERGVHIPERGFFRLQGATDDPHAPISGDVLLTRADRQRYKVPVYNLTTGQPLPDVKGGNLAIHFDNSAFHSLFPDAELAIVRIPKPPDRASPIEVAEHQARMQELVEQGIEIDGQRYDLVLATGARKHGDFLFAHTPYWKKIAPTFEKIMAYGGIMLTSCREPPRQFKHLRVLIVEEDGEYGTGDCNAKMADWLFEEFGQQGHRFRAGQFRLLAEREDESGMVVVGKGTIKRMDHQDVDERGQPYDLILPESSLKGNSPGPSEYVWDTTHLGFNAWSERRRVKFSYQYLQWLSPDNIRALFPRIDEKVEVLKEAMTSTEGARKLLRIARKESPEEQDRELEERPVPELLEALAGQEMDEEEEFRILDTILAGDQSDVMVHHPYVRHKLRQIMRRVWHDLAIGGGVEVPSFTWQPDSFRDKMDWIPLRHIICPELPDGEVASFRYPIRTKHDDQIWYNLTSVEAMRKRGEELTSPYREYQANYRDALKRAEYAGPTPARQRKIQAAQEEMAALQTQLEEARKPVEPPVRGTPAYWTWQPEMLEAKRAEQQEAISHLQAQVDELAQRIEKLQAPTDYQARKMRRARREAGEWQRRMQEEAESERYQAGLQLLKLAGDKDTRAFFGYARQHKGVAYLSHQTAQLVGGDFDGDTGQHIPLPKEYKPLDEIERPDRDFSDLYPIFQEMKEEGWGQVETTEKIKRRLATHWAPEDGTELTEENRLWLDGAVIEMTGHRQEFTAALMERVRHALHENEAVRTYEEVRTGQRSRLPPGFWLGEEGQRNARTILTHLIANGELDPDAPLTQRRLQKLHLSSVVGQQVFAEGLRPVVEETDQQVIEINEIIEGTLKEQRSMDSALELAEEYGLNVHAWVTERIDLTQEESFDLARRYNRRQMAIQALKNMDNAVGLVTYTIAKVNAESDPLNLVDLSGVVWREGKSIGRRGVTSWIEEHVAESVADAELVDERRSEFTAALTRHVNEAIHGNEAARTYEEVRAGQRSRLPRGFWQGEEGQQNARAVLTHLVANDELDPGAPLKEQLKRLRLATVGRVFAGRLEAMVGRAGREASRIATGLQETETALGLARKYGFDTHAWTDARRESVLARIQAIHQEMEEQENEIANLRAEGKRARKALDKALQRYDAIFNRILEIGDRYGLTREEIATRCKEQVLNQLGFEQQQEVDKFKYDTGADMEYVNALSRLVETPAWLAEHKKADVFVDRAVFSEHDDAQSVLWNHVSSRFEAYAPPPMPLEFYRDQVPGNFTQEQYDEAYERVRQYNRTIGTALRLRQQEEEAEKKGELAELLADRADGEVSDRVLKTAIQDLIEWSGSITEDRESWACALWHAAHNAAIASQDRRMSRYQEATQRARAQGKPSPREPAYATASAAFHAFQKEITDFLEQVERQPATEVTITGVQHHLTQEEMDEFNEEGRVVQIEIALETPVLETRMGEAKVPEQRLVVYQLKDDGERRWIGVVPRGNAGDAEPGRYQAHLKRRLRKKLKEGQSRYANSLHGTLAPAPATTASPASPSEVRRLLISGSRRMDQAGLEYARTLVRHARSRGWEIIVGDNPQGVDAEVIRAAIEEGYDDHLVIYGAHRQCRIKDTGRAKVTLTDSNYYERDRIMAGRCDAAVGVWNGNSPGTQKAIASAAEMGKRAFLMARDTEGWKNRLPGDRDIFSME